jgi:hypothetical protein
MLVMLLQECLCARMSCVSSESRSSDVKTRRVVVRVISSVDEERRWWM